MKRLRRVVIIFLVIVLSVYVWGTIYSIENPLANLPRNADTIRILDDLKYLTSECRYRNYHDMPKLNLAALYIKARFNEIGDSVTIQKYIYKDMEFRNIIFSLGPEDAERIIIGAHYDVCGNNDGADDNASGVAGLIEIARLLKDIPLKYRIDFVAYANEEPPFFKGDGMGSYIHAKYLHDNKISVKGMICLEMIGFYQEAKHTQHYPLPFLKWFYGSKGNYITVVQKFGNGSFGRFIKETMKMEQTISTKSFAGPKWLPGVDFSDHLNYWKFGYSAVMLSNTAFYRNYNYHEKTDKLETLNVGNIGLVVDGLYRTVLILNIRNNKG